MMDLLKSVLVSIVILGLLFLGIYLAGRKELLEKAESNLAKAQDLYEYKNDASGALNLLELEPEKQLQEKYYFLKFLHILTPENNRCTFDFIQDLFVIPYPLVLIRLLSLLLLVLLLLLL